MNDNLDAGQIVGGEEQIIANKKSRKKFVIWGCIILVILAVLLYFGYQKLNSSPQSIYERAINNTYNLLNDNLKDSKNNKLNIDIKNEPFVVNLDAKLTSNMKQLEEFSGKNYNFNLGFDYKNQNANLGLGIKDNKTALDILGSFTNKNMYLSSNDLFNKVLNIGEYDLFKYINLDNFNLKIDDEYYGNINYVLKASKNIVIKSLDKEKFTTSKETLTIEGKKHKLTKNTYTLDKENMERTLKFVIDEMTKDDKLLESLADIAKSLDSTTKIDKDSIKEALKDGNTNVGDFETVYIDLYSDGLNNIIAGSFRNDDITPLKFTNVNDLFTLDCSYDNNEFTIKETKKDNYDISYKAKGTEIANLKMVVKDDEVTADYTLNIEGTKVNGKFAITDVATKKDKTEADFLFIVNANILGTKIDLELDGTLNVSKGKVTPLDTKNSVNMNDLSQKEMLDLYNNLTKKLKDLGLNSILESINM